MGQAAGDIIWHGTLRRRRFRSEASRSDESTCVDAFVASKMKLPVSTVFAATSLGHLAVNAFEYPDCVNGPLANNTVCNPKAPAGDRAAALVAAMNISEKLVNLVEYARSGSLLISWAPEADRRRIVRVKVPQDLVCLRIRGGAKPSMGSLAPPGFPLQTLEMSIETPLRSQTRLSCLRHSTTT